MVLLEVNKGDNNMKKRAIILVLVLIVSIAGITAALVLDNNANTENRKKTTISDNSVNIVKNDEYHM